MVCLGFLRGLGFISLCSLGWPQNSCIILQSTEFLNLWMQLSASKIDSKRWPRKGLVKAQMNILQIVPKVGSVCPVSGPKQYTLDNSKVHVYFPQLCRGTSNRCTSSQPLSWIVIATVWGGSFSSELTLRDSQATSGVGSSRFLLVAFRDGLSYHSHLCLIPTPEKTSSTLHQHPPTRRKE